MNTDKWLTLVNDLLLAYSIILSTQNALLVKQIIDGKKTWCRSCLFSVILILWNTRQLQELRFNTKLWHFIPSASINPYRCVQCLRTGWKGAMTERWTDSKQTGSDVTQLLEVFYSRSSSLTLWALTIRCTKKRGALHQHLGI